MANLTREYVDACRHGGPLAIFKTGTDIVKEHYQNSSWPLTARLASAVIAEGAVMAVSIACPTLRGIRAVINGKSSSR